MNLPVVDFTILFNKKDITKDISGDLIGIQYTDKVAGESDSIEITIQDADNRWQNTWYPEKGDTLQLFIRHEGAQLDSGVFEVDELAAAGSRDGDTFIVKGLAAGVKKRLRTKRSYAHEDKTLREIANTVGGNLGLQLVGNVPEIRIHRVNQYREDDLAFLNRIGVNYGCVFSVRENKLVFTYYKDLEGRNSSLVLTKQDLITYDLRDTTNKTYSRVRVRHHDPYKKMTTSYFSREDVQGLWTGADNLEMHSRVENEQQAEAVGEHALHQKNTAGVTGDIVLPGNLLFVAGNNFSLHGVGKLSGIFHINQSTHTLNRDGAYQTAGSIKRVKTIDPVYFKTK